MRIRSGLLLSALLVSSVPAQAGTKAQMSIVPSPPDCVIAGLFCINVTGSCSGDNADCAAGTLSPKSKITLKDKLGVKVKVKDVTDGTGAPITTGPEGDASNLVVKIVFSTCPVDTGMPPLCVDTTTVYLKLVLDQGDGTVDVDLTPVFASAPIGTPFALLGVSVLDPPGGPCSGGNSSTDITNRLNAAGCDSGIVRGVGGFVKAD